MKFLQAAVLSAILVSCGNAATYTRIYVEGSLTKKVVSPSIKMNSWPLSRFKEGENVDNVLKSKNLDYIARFINEAGQANTATLRKLCLKKPEKVGKVLEKANFPQDVLVEVASSQRLMCNPEKFLMLLNKIATQKDRLSAITNGIEKLSASKSTKCLFPLLEALKKASNDEHLKDIAFQKTFKKVATRYGYGSAKLKPLFEHPAITLDVIADYINNAGQANASTLHVLCKKNPVEVIGQVLERVNFPQDALVEVASSQKVACNPEKFLALFNKIAKQKGQASAITNGIKNLFHSKHRECIPPLVIAMRGKPLEEVAVKRAFEEVVKADVYEPGVLWCTFEHPVITRQVYVEGLMTSAEHRVPNRTFNWLLEKADNDDLRALQAKAGYADLSADLRASVDLAMPKTLDGRTRLSVTIPENKPETSKKNASTSTNHGAFGHFHTYLTDRDVAAREFGYSTFKV